MRKLIVTTIVSLDGYVAGPGGDVMAMPMDHAFDESNVEHMRSAEGVQSGKGFGEGTVDPRLMPLKKLVKNEPEKE